jgi:hypothetical protein
MSAGDVAGTLRLYLHIPENKNKIIKKIILVLKFRQKIITANKDKTAEKNHINSYSLQFSLKE